MSDRPTEQGYYWVQLKDDDEPVLSRLIGKTFYPCASGFPFQDLDLTGATFSERVSYAKRWTSEPREFGLYWIKEKDRCAIAALHEDGETFAIFGVDAVMKLVDHQHLRWFGPIFPPEEET